MVIAMTMPERQPIEESVPAAPTTPDGTTPAGTGGTGGRLPAVRPTGRTPVRRRTQPAA